MRIHGPENIVHTVVVFFLAVATLFPFVVPDASAQSEIFVPLGNEGFDMAIDPMRQQLYVSVPSQNEVVVISSVSGLVTNRIRTDAAAIREALGVGTNVLVGTMPHGIDISLDNSLLFVALNGASSVIYVDLDTFGLEQVVIGTELGDARTWDVIEGAPNRVFASANPGSSGLSYIVMIERDLANAASRVANETIIRSRPVFARSPSMDSLYVGSGFSPNSLYKLDLTVGDAPIILEDDHGSVSGTDHLEVSPDGSLIYLGSGQVLQTADFIQIGLVGAGIPRLNSDGSLAYVAKEPGIVEVYETSFFTRVDTVDLPCSFDDIRAFELLNDGDGFLVLGDDNVCGLGSVTFQTPTCSVAPSYDAAGLTLGFTVGTPAPVTWNLWINIGTEVSPLWSVALPAIAPPFEFELPLPSFPQVGTIGFLSTFTNSGGIACSEFATVDTGAGASPTTLSELSELIRGR